MKKARKSLTDRASKLLSCDCLYEPISIALFRGSFESGDMPVEVLHLSVNILLVD